jgi:predicted deacylase
MLRMLPLKRRSVPRCGAGTFPLAFVFFTALFTVNLPQVATAQELASPGAATIQHDVRPGPGVTRSGWLSDYFTGIRATPADTRVYYLESGKPGATVFLAGGTHANEIAGIVTATLFVERARVTSGRLIVIPNLNNSASTWTESSLVPSWIALTSPSGTRFFKYGARYTNAVHQGTPDPERYIHPKGGDPLPGEEARNLDRAYPGKPDGNLTEKLAYAVIRLLIAEKVDVAFDLHEAGPESRLANMIVANPKNLDLAALAVLSLESEGIKMKLEPSSDTFHGLSHREWGDATNADAFLIETPNPAQSSDNANPSEDPRYPLSGRVATHLATVLAILGAWNDMGSPSETIEIVGVPEPANVEKSGAGAYLQ